MHSHTCSQNIGTRSCLHTRHTRASSPPHTSAWRVWPNTAAQKSLKPPTAPGQVPSTTFAPSPGAQGSCWLGDSDSNTGRKDRALRGGEPGLSRGTWSKPGHRQEMAEPHATPSASCHTIALGMALAREGKATLTFRWRLLLPSHLSPALGCQFPDSGEKKHPLKCVS